MANVPGRTAETVSSSIDAWDLVKFVQERVDRNTDCLYEEAVQHLDRQLLKLILQHTRGNQAAAARMLV